MEQLRFLLDRKAEFVPSQSGLEAEPESLKELETERCTLLRSEGMRHPLNAVRGPKTLRCGFLT